MRLNIGNKIILVLSVTIVFVLSIAFYLITLMERERLFNELRQDSLIISRTIQEIVGMGLFDIQSGRDYIQVLTEHLGDIEGVMWVEVFDKEATIVAHTNKERIGGKPLEVHEFYVKEIFKNGKPFEEEDSRGRRYNRFTPVYHTTEEGKKEVTSVVELVMDMQPAFKKVAIMRKRMMVTATVLVAILLGLNLWFIRNIIVLPIRKLLDMTKIIAEGNFRQRVDITSQDELGMLTTSFNNMIDDLDKTTTSIDKLNKEVAEREKLETSLKESEESYRKLIGTAQDAIISIDEGGIVNVWNESAEKIFGYSEDEIIGKPITTIIPERYREQHENGLRRFLKTGKTRIMDKAVDVHGITKEGVEVPIEMSLSAQKDGKNRYSFMAIIRDITERKMRDGEIQKLTYAIEQSPVSVVITDTEGNIEYVNKKFMQVTGYSYEEVIGKNPRVLKSDDRTSEEYRELWETITSGKEWQGEFCNKDKNGKIYWESASISPVKNDAGVITHFIAVKEDISVPKQIEENLRKLSQAVEQSPSSVMITDTEGKIEYVNPKFTKLTGYTSEEAIGQTPRLLKSGKTPREEYKKLWKTIKSGEEWRGEFCNKKKNGILYWEHTSVSPVKDDKGITTHFVAVNEDVTERRQMEEMLIRSEKVAMVKMKEATKAKENAEVAATAKGEFLANMSHEIRTPMNGIIGMTDLLLDTKLTREQSEFTATVRNSADALLTIINDILDFSKIEAGKMKLENIDFDLHIAVDGTIDILVVKAHEKGLGLSCFIDPEVPSLLRGDPGKLRQVIINMVNNAMKFTNDGEVVISASLAEETESHATVRFAVQDTGIGIPADRMDRLFKSFSQVDASTTRKYGGTGLGLTISKQIVELMGGQIGVESKEGKGSTFWFTVVLEKQPPEQQQPIELGDIENIRVLVVDDNDTNRHIFKKYLESWHCRVEDARSAVEAMKELSEAVGVNDPFKVVLLDYCMPEMDGESLCREIKADPQLKDLILVILTSIGKRGDAEHFRKLGFAAYLTKPLKKSQLLDCLRLVTGESASTGKHTTGQIVTQYSISEDHKRRVSILLAEDNMVNQKIALRILEKKLGFHADVVNNGREAIESLERSDYDLVLMDCQMPKMDGYEATRKIRDENSSVRNHRIPIIAMTANATNGDRQKCLDAGMDDYITKPINRQEFTNVIKRYLKNGREQQFSPSSSPDIKEPGKAKQEDVPETIYSEYADDADLVELIDEFATGLEADVKSMRKVLGSGDHDGLRRLAHQMKGAGGSYGYPMLTEAAKILEEAAKVEDVKVSTPALDKLEVLCQAVDRGREIQVKQ